MASYLKKLITTPAMVGRITKSITMNRAGKRNIHGVSADFVNFLFLVTDIALTSDIQPTPSFKIRRAGG